MKRFPKLIATLLVLAMAIGIFAAMPVAAADYSTVRLKTAQITVGYYSNTACTGEITKNSAPEDYTHEVSCLIDNDNNSAFWSKPFKFKDFKDQGGSKVPVILIDVANGGEGVTIAGYDMRLRSFFDCMPLHFELQATTSAGSDNWQKIIEKSGLTWDSPNLRFEFPEVTVYKVRILFYDIADCDISRDNGYGNYAAPVGDETRFALSEIDLLKLKEGSSSGSSSGGSSSGSSGSSGGSTTTTRPVIQFPTSGGSQSATKAPTQPATKAPTQPATKAPTTGGSQSATKAPTQPATQAPTTGVSQPATQAPTTNVAATEPTGTVDPSAPTVDPSAPTVDPSAPTVDPSAPTDEPTVEPTNEPTAEPTVQTTEPEETTPTTDDGGEQKPDNTWIIIVAIVAAALIAGGAVFFIIKKKKQQA